MTAARLVTTIDLTPRLRLAADYIDSHGWVRGVYQDYDGRVCLTGSIRHCAPEDADTYLICAVLVDRGRAEGWNDEPDRTEADVVGYLRTAEITDTDLEGTFGPQWAEIVALARSVRTLTKAEAERLSAARSADATGVAVRYAVAAARSAARYPAIGAARDATRSTARDAAIALVIRDLVGQHGFTQAHYDALTLPLRRAGITVHPDDEETD